MFIAAFVRDDNVFIFDTSDCTLEAVSSSILKRSVMKRLDIKNLHYSDMSKKHYVDMKFMNYGCFTDENDFVHWSHLCVTIRGRKPIQLGNNISGYLMINNYIYTRHTGSYVDYFFMFMDCVIFRCRWKNNNGKGFFTVIVGKDNSLEVYESGSRDASTKYKGLNRYKLVASKLEFLGVDI